MLISILLLLLGLISSKVPPETYLTFTDYCQYFNYDVETHKILTDDGYILTFFRLQKGRIKEGKKPIYMQHGLIDSSDTFIVNYQDQAPAFILADAGYDVWVGNSRGNKYSKEHQYLKINSKQFWNFTWSQMAEFDLPCAFKYIAAITNVSKIDYVGHSQGTLIMFAALSLRNPVIKQYLGKFIALAPILSIRHQESNLIRTIKGIEKYTVLLEQIGIWELLAYNDPTAHIAANTCERVPPICAYSLRTISDQKPELDNIERMPVVMGHYPAGTSLYDNAHFAQMIEYEQFGIKRFDYGRKLNLQIYGQDDAPWYDHKAIEGEIYLFYGIYDKLADSKDVEELIQELKPKNPSLFARSYEAGHATFIWGQNQEIMNDLLAVLKDEL